MKMTLQEIYNYLSEGVDGIKAEKVSKSNKKLKEQECVEEFRHHLKNESSLFSWEMREEFFKIVFEEDNPEKWQCLKEYGFSTNEDKIPKDLIRRIFNDYIPIKGNGFGTQAYLYFKRYFFFRNDCGLEPNEAYTLSRKITVTDYKFLSKAGMQPTEIIENINGKFDRNIFNIFKKYGYNLATCLNNACEFVLEDKDINQVNDLVNLLKYLGMDKKEALVKIISKYGYLSYFDFDPSLPPKQKDDKMYYGDSSENQYANFYLMLKNLMEWRKEEQSGQSNTYIINQGKFEETIPNPRARGEHNIRIHAFTGKTDYIKDTIFGDPDRKKVKPKEYKSIKSAWKDFIRLYNIEEEFPFQENCYIMKYNKGE